MQVSETLSEGLKREFKIVIPFEDLNKKLMGQLGEMQSRARIPGFRPGKVPISHLRRLHGRSLMMDVIRQTLDSTSREILLNRNEKPAFQPRVDLAEDKDMIERVVNGDEDLCYSLSFEIVPPIELTDFSSISLTRQIVEVSEEDIDKALDEFAKGKRPYNVRETGEESRSGDRITMDFQGKIDGVAFEGGTLEDAQLVLGSGDYIPGFEEQLIGVRAGDDVIVDVVFPADYKVERLAGHPASFSVHVKEIAVPGELAIDDDFARELGLDSLDGLRKALGERISGEVEQISKIKLKNDLLDILVERHSFDLPPTLVERELESIWQRQSRSDTDEPGESAGEESAQREQYREMAEKHVLISLLLSHLCDVNGINASSDEINRALIEQIRQFPGQEKMVYDYYQKNPQAFEQLRKPVLEDKAIDYILSLSKVDSEVVKREELLRTFKSDQI